MFIEKGFYETKHVEYKMSGIFFSPIFLAFLTYLSKTLLRPNWNDNKFLELRT